MKNLLALRVGDLSACAIPLERVAEMGFQGLEITWPQGWSADDVRRKLSPAGLRVTSLSVRARLADDAFLPPFEAAAAQAQAVGAGVLFVSLKKEGLSQTEAVDRLRRIGGAVAKHGARVGMETHPDLTANGDDALATLSAVNHPAIGWNFDTANIYYYNEGRNAVDEARKAARLVVSVHLKETNGGFKSNQFGVLGTGVVDFAGVFDTLNSQGFHGPFTMEVEGPLMKSETPEELAGKIAAGVAHLRRLGKV
ncbi:MAG TPA: sugar phosphate isomerase/epimerase family protein [Candidatus Brocadiia bacterium]|nr:sugar phosphate isomerase/epimerase family protein [Candidatus Brocadiia bacterium]